MKKIAFIFVITLLVTTACKKGPNDPSISFLSRKARVVGEWTIKSGSSIITTTNGTKIISQDRFSFTENSYDYVGNDENNQTTSAKGIYFLKMKFEKGGNVTITETYDNKTTTINGTWNFNAGVGKAKSKEQIIIHATFVNYPVGGANFSGNQTDITYTLTELRNKKMNMYSELRQENTDNTTFSFINTYEMKQ